MNSQLGELSVARRGAAQMFRLSGEWDLSNAWQIEDALVAAIRESTDEIVVDLDAVRFMDAQLLRCLLRAKAAAEGRNVGFVIVPPRDPDVWRVARLVDFPMAA